ncbi:MAG: cupin domain-containing protein [Actinomycetota bacterium]|nr:cupin domain-containing protein [Actinomycetota bacterium]
MGYFSGEAGSGYVRIERSDSLRSFEIAPGITIRPLLGERLNINIVTLAPNAVAALHTHDEEQLGYVVAGSCDFTDGTTTTRLAAGDVYHAASNAPHGATAHNDGCVIIDAFAPPRAGIRELLDS